MSPSSAPAKPADVSPQRVIADLLNRYKPVIGKLLARTDVAEETFVAQIANAMRVNPKLWECEPETVLGAALRCAQVGLAPNDGNNLCSIIPYGRAAAFQLGYGGVMELARRANPGIIFDGHVVYRGDRFSYEMVDGVDRLHYAPTRRGRRGPAEWWFVRVEYPDGRVRVHALNRDDVEYHRSFSRQRDGEAWTKSYDAMALKSVVLDMKRWLASSPQLAAAQAADGTVVDVRELDPDQPELPTPTPGDADAEWVAEAKGETS